MMETGALRSHKSTVRHPGFKACHTGALTCALVLAGPHLVFGQSTEAPYASFQVEHDSNVFRLPNSQAADSLYGNPTLGDTDTRAVIGLNTTYLWSLQKFTSTLEAREIDYAHFTDNNHYEYLANLQLDWKLANALDGTLQFREERLAAPFANRDSTTLEINVDRNIAGKLNYNFDSDWRIETGINFHDLKAPLQLYPDFVDHEVGTHAGILYVGLANLTYGIIVDRLDGSYDHAVGVGAYAATSAGVKFTYALTGLSSVNGSVGYTKRTQAENEGTVSAITGQLGYSRQLTGKTSVLAQVTRTVDGYVAAGGSEIDTTASVGVNWQATYKLGVVLSGGYTRSTFVGEVIPGSVATGRLDHSPVEMLNVTYQALKKLQLKAYINRQSRTSNYEIYEYTDNTYGIQALAHWR